VIKKKKAFVARVRTRRRSEMVQVGRICSAELGGHQFKNPGKPLRLLRRLRHLVFASKTSSYFHFTLSLELLKINDII